VSNGREAWRDGRAELIVMKVLAARARDLGDVQGLLRTITPDEVRQVHDLLRRLDPAALEDFESLRTLARLEFGDAGPPEEPGRFIAPRQA
jgi:hypothetical protein